MHARSLHGNREISSLTAGGSMHRRPALGRRGAEADDVRTGEVTLTGSTDEVGEQDGLARCGVDGGKRWDREKCGHAQHGPDSAPAKLCPQRTLTHVGPPTAVRRHRLAIRTVCGNSARTDLCGGCPVMGIPTAMSVGARPARSRRSSQRLTGDAGLRAAEPAVAAALWPSLTSGQLPSLVLTRFIAVSGSFGRACRWATNAAPHRASASSGFIANAFANAIPASGRRSTSTYRCPRLRQNNASPGDSCTAFLAASSASPNCCSLAYPILRSLQAAALSGSRRVHSVALSTSTCHLPAVFSSCTVTSSVGSGLAGLVPPALLAIGCPPRRGVRAAVDANCGRADSFSGGITITYTMTTVATSTAAAATTYPILDFVVRGRSPTNLVDTNFSV